MKLADFFNLSLTRWEMQVMARLVFSPGINVTLVFGEEFAFKFHVFNQALSGMSDAWRRELCANELLRESSRGAR